MSNEPTKELPTKAAELSQLPTPYSQPALPATTAKTNLAATTPTQRGELVTNLRADDEGERVLVSRLMSPVDDRLMAYVGKTIEVSAVVMSLTEFESLSSPGEMVDKVYATIQLADGKIIGTTSNAVITQLAFLVGSNKRGAWEPPVKLEVRSHQSKKGLTYISVRQELPAKKATAKK